ncbi:hypothetical protein Mapa_012619 [Marchantia paleacea]|nr:hypothetical protein Mapa_012619 [Marchantia paleacea]
MAIRKVDRVKESSQVVNETRCFCLPGDFGIGFRLKGKCSDSDPSIATQSKSRSSSYQSTGSVFKSKGSDSDSPNSSSKLIRSSFQSAGSHFWSKGSDGDSPSSLSIIPCLRVPETEEGDSVHSSVPLRKLRCFAYKDLENATKCFNECNLLRHAPYKVYKGTLPSGEVVYVRRLSDVDSSRFQREIETQSRLEHENLACLVGFSDDQGEQLLVSEALGNGTLEDHLQGPSGCSLAWNTRFGIALGVARAIAYLHWKQDPPIIHEDLRPSNIFLGDDFVAKVANYTPPCQCCEFVAIARSWEYHDPESVSQQQTEYCNVYSFGVILLQLLTGRPTHDSGTKKSLVHRVRKHQQEAEDGNFEAMRPLIDRLIANESAAVLKAVMNLALRCVGRDRDDRPTMEEVVEALQNLIEH